MVLIVLCVNTANNVISQASFKVFDHLLTISQTLALENVTFVTQWWKCFCAVYFSNFQPDKQYIHTAGGVCDL